MEDNETQMFKSLDYFEPFECMLDIGVYFLTFFFTKHSSNQCIVHIVN